jgi:hypothetical protein
MLHIDIKKLGRIDGVGHRILGRQNGVMLVGNIFMCV